MSSAMDRALTAQAIDRLRIAGRRAADILARVEVFGAMNAGGRLTLAAADFDFLADQFARETGGRVRLSNATLFGVQVRRA